MKKTYIQPLTEVVRMGTMSFICASKGVTSNNGIDYGGVDEDGSKDPSANRFKAWDDDDWDKL